MFLDVVEGGIGRDCHLLLSSVNGEANAFIPGETHFFSNNRDMCALRYFQSYILGETHRVPVSRGMIHSAIHGSSRLI